MIRQSSVACCFPDAAAQNVAGISWHLEPISYTSATSNSSSNLVLLVLLNRRKAGCLDAVEGTANPRNGAYLARFTPLSRRVSLINIPVESFSSFNDIFPYEAYCILDENHKSVSVCIP